MGRYAAATMRVLVTGAAGFIGSHLCEALVDADHDVVGIDCFEPHYPRAAKEQNLASLASRSRFELQELDLRRDDLGPAFRGVEVVVHEAAKPGLPTSWTCLLYTSDAADE